MYGKVAMTIQFEVCNSPSKHSPSHTAEKYGVGLNLKAIKMFGTILSRIFFIDFPITLNNTLPNNHPKTSNQVTTKRIPQDYFKDSTVHKQFSHLAAQLDEEQSHLDIDWIYTNFCGLIDEQLIHKPHKPNRMYGRVNKCKPWWNSHLSELYKCVSVSLKNGKRRKTT